MTGGTAAEQLRAILATTDSLSVTGEGDLLIEDCAAKDLLDRYGSPLYVVSERTLRANYRRIHRAFADRWPNTINILYAIKANNNFAIRAIMSQEGAGGDCFGEAELYATFMGGADPDKVVLNGSNKTFEEVRRAAELGVRINIDSEDEIDFVRDIADQQERPVRVNLRLKLFPEGLSEFGSDYFGFAPGRDVVEFLADEKWGFSVDVAPALIERLRAIPGVTLDGYNMHLGRVTRDPRGYGEGAKELAHLVVELHKKTGFAPRLLDIGGGWARERDPEARTLSLNPHTIEEYAEATCSALRQRLQAADLPVPELWLEPGRYIIGNAVMLLARVGAIKRDLGKVWVHVDASTNNLMRVDTSASKYHIVPASNMDRSCVQPVTLVGPTCVHSILGVDRMMPELSRGEPVVILDAGMYAETTSTQFNGVPRPATALVDGANAELIKERETIRDVFQKHIIPERLQVRPAPGRNLPL